MTPLTLTLTDNRTGFRPGESLTGLLAWQFPTAPKSLELRLFWYTAGKGDVDAEIVDTLVITAPADQRAFAFTLPNMPYSFSGTLISLIWALEVVTPACEPLRVPFTLSPSGAEMVLAQTGAGG